MSTSLGAVGDHGKEICTTNPIKMIGFAHNRFEIDVGLIDKLVPVKMLDCGNILFAHLDKLLLKLALDLADTA